MIAVITRRSRRYERRVNYGDTANARPSRGIVSADSTVDGGAFAKTVKSETARDD